VRGTGFARWLDAAATGAAALIAVAMALVVVATFTLSKTSGLLRAELVLATGASAALAAVIPLRARAVRRENEQMRRQERILRAAAYAADRFVNSDSLDDSIAEVLERLGHATSASRVYVFENTRDAQGQMLMSIRHEWCAVGVRPTIQDRSNQAFPYAAGYMHWLRKLHDGLPVLVGRSDTAGTERDDMEAAGTRSVAAFPIYVAGTWWGFLGLDDTVREREWSSGEVEGLAVAAAAYGAALSRARSTHELGDAETRFRVLVEQAPIVVYVNPLERASAEYISPQIEALTGYSVDEWRSRPDLWGELLHDDDRASVTAARAEHIATEQPFRMEYRLRARDGREVWVHDEAVIVRDDTGAPAHSQGVMQDITDRKTVDARIHDLAYRDALTGLPNLEMFANVAELALTRARRSDRAAAVLLIDIDGFKLANDSLGTEGGDELLRQIGSRVSMTLRDVDTVARRGADDFLVLLTDLDRDDYGDLQGPLLFAESVASRIRDTLKQPFDIEDREIFLTASIGITVFPDDADDVETLILHAEHAVRATKRDGPGGFAAYGANAFDSKATFDLLTDLRRAVERREWKLVYQPLVELATGAVHGVEALLRWASEDRAAMSPADFIPLAEDIGLIEDIGDWVVEEIVEQEHRWRGEGMRLELGFNLSPRQFLQPDLAERILAKLDERRVDPGTIVVEITETSAMRDADRASQILWDLHSRGLRLALDDFGTGYSSLSRLRNLPVDILKIDRSFVSGVDLDPQAAKIVTAFIQLGQGLGMTTLAEGIETDGEWRFLAEAGCELGQGFYFSRPVEPSELSRRWRAGELVLTSGAIPPAPEPGKREYSRVWRPGHG
jgi:diguanylate cyclase (GGDEF)-like protein/PAS domain S-box-containing protein